MAGAVGVTMPRPAGCGLKILIACFSRTGFTERLANVIRSRWEGRGHTVAVERIEPLERKSRWNLLARQIYQYPVFGLSLVFPAFRRWWLRHYRQPEDAIRALAFPDVSGFDHVCLGGPKWAFISYPVARYLRQVRGLRGKPVSAFATFGGPPFEVFELELLFTPLGRRVREAGGTLGATLGLSSNHHELFLLPLFRVLTRLFRGRSLASFTVDSRYGEEKVREFCDRVRR